MKTCFPVQTIEKKGRMIFDATSRKLVGFLACKTKMKTEDFIVEEMTDLKIQTGEGAGPYHVYRLRKEGWNTVDALIRLAKENRISLRDIQYGGKKDRHGITEQFITSRSRLRLPASLEGAVQLKEIGSSEEPMTPGRIAANRFRIVLRSLQPSELSHLQRNFEAIREYGYINYFDSQRFSTFDREEGLPAFALYAGNYEQALKMLLLGTFRREKSHAKDRKAELLKSWGQWDACLQKADTTVERRVFAFLKESQHLAPSDFAGALDLLPYEELLMMLSAFQAFLWNHMVSCYIERHAVSTAAFFKTRTGILAFPAPDDRSISLNQELCVPGKGQHFSPEFQAILQSLLTQLGLPVDCTQIAHLRSVSMNACMRRMRILPDDLQMALPEDDEMQKGRKKIELQFTLPAGAYGTMLVRRLTLRARF
jgi:tRNA pseudouridine13 synthase